MTDGAPPASEPWLQISGSRFFLDWLAEVNVSLAFTTYQTGKLFLIGRRPNDRISAFERTYTHCMGMHASADGRTLWVSSRFQLWRFEQAPAAAVPYHPGEDSTAAETDPGSFSGWTQRGYDVVYIPRVGYTTGHVDVHDVAVEAGGRVVFVNTLFGCLATISDVACFTPLWKPPFLSSIVPEDRCHLNGLALRDGKAAFVTVVSQSDVADGWRDQRRDGGCVLEVPSGEVVCSGLSMPHSPRWYRDQLWVLNSGTGEFGRVDRQSGRFEPVTFCPGYLRGLAFCGDHAVVTLSRPRNRTFQGLPLDDRLASRNAEAQSGLQVINLHTGAVDHWLRVEGTRVTELYDAAVLPGVRQPMAIGFMTNDIERLMVISEPEPL